MDPYSVIPWIIPLCLKSGALFPGFNGIPTGIANAGPTKLKFDVSYKWGNTLSDNKFRPDTRETHIGYGKSESNFLGYVLWIVPTGQVQTWKVR